MQGWKPRGHDGDEHEEHRYQDEGSGIGGFDLDEHARQDSGKRKGCDETNRNPQHAKVESLSYHQTEDARRRRAQGHPHSDLGRSLADRSRKHTIPTPARSAAIVENTPISA